MITGTINVVTDIQLAMQFSQQCKVLFIGELNNQLPPNFIEYSILLPPVEALEAEINGNIEVYYNIYSQYLTYTPYCQEAIATILAAISRGINVIFYIEEGDNLSHKKFLMDYFMNMYGILLGSETTKFCYDIRFEPIINTILYTWLGDAILPLQVLVDSIPNAMELKNICIRYGINPFERIAETNNLYMKEDQLLRWIDNYKAKLCMVRNSLIGKDGKPITQVIRWIDKEKEKESKK